MVLWLFPVTFLQKNETPTFNLNLGADGFDIAKSFKDLELLRNLAPIAKLIQGKLNTNINLAGDLDSELFPKLSSLSGDALTELLATKINADQGELFSKLEGSLSFIDFDKLDLKDLKTKLEFANGKVNVKPFQLTYEDITIDVSGSHGFDKNLDYSAVFNVPAKYLGSDVNQLIGKINNEEAKKHKYSCYRKHWWNLYTPLCKNRFNKWCQEPDKSTHRN